MVRALRPGVATIRVDVGDQDRITTRYELETLPQIGDDPAEAPSSQVRALVPLYAVPWLVATYDQLQTMPLGVRESFIVSRIDGRSNVSMIVQVAGLPESQTLAIFGRLLKLGAIELRDPPSGLR
jgi:hypothetical protein